MARTAILGDGGNARVLQTICPDSVLLGEGEEPLDTDDLIVGVGVGLRTAYPMDRVRIFNSYPRERFISVAALESHVEEDCQIGLGVAFMAGSIVQTGTMIGDNVLVNTGAQIDHGCVITDHCVIGPGAIICGEVKLGRGCIIGAGAIIVQGVKLTDGTRIKAGTLVVGQHDLRVAQHVQVTS